jgi:bla regulator protein BlaR1
MEPFLHSLRVPLSVCRVAACVAIAALAVQSQDVPDWQTAAGGEMAFAVASVKPATAPRFPNLPMDNGDAKPPGGRFSASFNLPFYIFFAYRLAAFETTAMNAQVRQLPKWANQEYAIDAKADGNPTKDQMRLMMQSLLADRFKLKLHFESREVPVLALTLVKPGKLGPNLRLHSEGPPCPDPDSFEMREPFAPPEIPKAGVAWPSQCRNPVQLGASNATWLGARDTTMELLARDLYGLGFGTGELDKPVVDQTGLQGRFDFKLELPPGMLSLGPPKPPNPDDPPKGTPFLNALRDQLGLKLMRSRGEVRMLIIDHVEKPSEN